MGEPTNPDYFGPKVNQGGPDLPIPPLRTEPLPREDGRPEWVAGHLGRDLRPMERALVSLVCDALRTGPWNLKWGSLEGSDLRASVAVRDDRLATYDADGLTRLVILAHDRCVRLQLTQSGPGRIRVSITRRQRNGEIYRRHPTIEQAVADVRGVGVTRG